MKIKRQKKANKCLSFYHWNFGFLKPYQLLVDGTFCFAALNNQVNIADNIPRYLQGTVNLATTQCAILEMEGLGSKLIGALKILKQYTVVKCGHEGKPVPAVKCMRSMLGKNKAGNRYFVATQDRDLQEIVRRMPGVPLLYLYGKTPILDSPSEASLQAVRDKSAGLSNDELVKINELKAEASVQKNEQKGKSKKKKVKAPNPLSCMKKKKKTSDGRIVKSNTKKPNSLSQKAKDELLSKANKT